MSSATFPLPARRWWILAVLSVAQLMVAVDVTVVNVALKRAQIELHFCNANRQWLMTAYALAFGSVLLLAGRLVDAWGRRVMLLVGLTGFALASALGGAANSFSTLVSARVAQGAFAAVLGTAVLATLTTTFREPLERARAFSLYGAVAASGAATGLVLGGVLTQWATWRWCFYGSDVAAVVALLGVLLFVTGNDRHGATRPDVAGILLVSGGLVSVLYALASAQRTSWYASTTLISLVVGVSLLVVFVVWEARASHPVVELDTIRNRNRGGSIVALVLTSAGVVTLTYFLALYLHETSGSSPLRTGVELLPLVAAIVTSATFASARLLAKVGPRPLVPAGMILAVLGMILFTRLTLHADYLGHVMPGLVVTGLGLGLVIGPATASATNGVRRGHAGATSAVVNAAVLLGDAVGTALLTSIARTVSSRFIARAAGVHHEVAPAILHGYAVAFWWAAGIFGVGAVATFLLLESGVPEYDSLAS